MIPEDKDQLLKIKQEVLRYLAQRNFGVHFQYGSYVVDKLNVAASKMPQENYYKNLFNNKLNLSFSSKTFFPIEEQIAIFEYLFNKTTISKEYLLDNVNDLTDGNWKKDISKFLSALTDKIEDKKEILLNINNADLALNNKNLKQINIIVQNLTQEDKIDFWINFFTKRKKSLNNNKGGTEIYKFLTENFTKEEIKENFINLSSYIKDVFEDTVDVDIFNITEKYQRIIVFNPSVVEKALKIPDFNKKKITFELPRMMMWLSSLMGYKHESIIKNNTVQVILSSNESINEDVYKQVVKDYLVFVKNSQGKVVENEEIFAKWYAKNKLDNKLPVKEIKVKTVKI